MASHNSFLNNLASKCDKYFIVIPMQMPYVTVYRDLISPLSSRFPFLVKFRPQKNAENWRGNAFQIT